MFEPYLPIYLANTASTPFDEDAVPTQLRLARVHPNPTNGTTHITYDLTTVGDARIEIFDASGRAVRVLEGLARHPGRHVIEWDGNDGSGNRVSSGTYFIQLLSGSETDQSRLTVLW